MLHRVVKTKEENAHSHNMFRTGPGKLSLLDKYQRINEVTLMLASLAWDYFRSWKKR